MQLSSTGTEQLSPGNMEWEVCGWSLQKHSHSMGGWKKGFRQEKQKKKNQRTREAIGKLETSKPRQGRVVSTFIILQLYVN